MKAFALIAVVGMLAGCTTQIHAPKEGNQPSTEKLGNFPAVFLVPLAIDRAEGAAGDAEALQRIDAELAGCLGKVFPNIQPKGAVGTGLRIEPVITDLKKVSTGERFFVGALAGSSAVLMKVRFTNTATKAVLADPIFYSKASAMSGAWTIGGNDTKMLSRIAANACEYAAANK